MVIIMFEAARDYVCVYVCAPEVCVFAWPTLSWVGCNMWAASALARCIVCRVLTLSPPSPSLSLSSIPKQTAATIAQMTNWAPSL